jgi:hypothetical protein
MENKVLEFITEFNTKLEEHNLYTNLLYVTDGNSEGIVTPEIVLWDDDNYSTEHIRKITLTSMLQVINNYNTLVEEMFSGEISAWEKAIEEQLKSKFELAKMKLKRTAVLRYKLIISGKYNEDFMEEFVDVVKEDFEYMFSGCKLDYEY